MKRLEGQSRPETAVYSLKNGTALNILSGEGWKSEDAVITTKRLYYNDRQGLLNLRSEEQVIDLKDITCAKIADWKPMGKLIFGILLLVIGILLMLGGATMASISLVVIGAAGIITYFILKKAFLTIEYAGGSIRFSVKKYSMQNVREFQRVIFAVKDKL